MLLCGAAVWWMIRCQWIKLRTFVQCSHCNFLVSWIIFSCHIARFILIYSKVTEGSLSTFKILSHHSLSQRSLSITFFHIFLLFCHSFFMIVFFSVGIYLYAPIVCALFYRRSSSLLPIFKDVTMCCTALELL